MNNGPLRQDIASLPLDFIRDLSLVRLLVFDFDGVLVKAVVRDQSSCVFCGIIQTEVVDSETAGSSRFGLFRPLALLLQ